MVHDVLLNKVSIIEHCLARVEQEYRGAFALLRDAGIIDAALKAGLQAMVGFRDVDVHDYRKPNLDVARNIVENHLDDLRAFCQAILKGSFA